MIKKSNLMVGALVLISTIGMFATNLILKKEYLKIDLTDVYKNYISVNKATYSVLNISGSNGYPIDIIHKPHNHVRVLRSREKHVTSHLSHDTLFIEFRGANISQSQAFLTDTPSGLIIESKDLVEVISKNTNNRIIGFSNQDFTLNLAGNSLSKVFDCEVKTFNISSKNKSQFEFSQSNQVDSLRIDMSDHSIAYFQEIHFADIRHTLQDSARWVLSKNVINRVFQ